MLKFFKNKIDKKDTKSNIDLLSKTASLLIHAAKIDEEYTNKEKEIIRKTIIELGAKNSFVDEIIKKAEEMEKNSNQILDFTKEIKNSNEDFKIKIIETLWGIIYSNDNADMYETNLMRRLSGLIYVEDKIIGSIKEKIKKKFSK
tara:strand:- start:4 stop:438 length:435 start_codon:yes stop_codon:yes gene_type:complete